MGSRIFIFLGLVVSPPSFTLFKMSSGFINFSCHFGPSKSLYRAWMTRAQACEPRWEAAYINVPAERGDYKHNLCILESGRMKGLMKTIIAF